MTFKLNRKLKKHNKFLAKRLFPSVPKSKVNFELDDYREVDFRVEYPKKGVSSMGFYMYDKKGNVTRYGFANFDLSPPYDILTNFIFPLKKGGKHFKKHLNHLAYVIAEDDNFMKYLTQGIASNNCENLAGFLGQLQGAKPDVTGVRLPDSTKWCFG